jgi:hypothetical protein
MRSMEEIDGEACDLYASTVPVLRFIRPMLTSGTILLLDNYDCFNASDERAKTGAEREFLGSEPGIRAEPLRTLSRLWKDLWNRTRTGLGTNRSQLRFLRMKPIL